MMRSHREDLVRQWSNGREDRELNGRKLNLNMPVRSATRTKEAKMFAVYMLLLRTMGVRQQAHLACVEWTRSCRRQRVPDVSGEAVGGGA